VKERKSARLVAREKEKRKLAREALSRWKDPPDALERFRETVALIVGHTSHGKAGAK
jgi:uridine kinase